MRPYNDTSNGNFANPPDTVSTLLLAAGVAQALDYPTDSHLCRISAMTTSNSALNCYVNLRSTAAAIPSSGTTATTSTTGVSIPVLGERSFIIAGGSTGFSAIANSSGYFHAEFWRR